MSNEFETVNVEQVSFDNLSVDVTRIVKCKPGQGKLNRWAAQAQVVITANGHASGRFKRDYNLGVSTYVCKNCAATAIARVNPSQSEQKVSGTALLMKCSVVNS